MKIAVISLLVGVAAGWLGQKSRFCTIGGIRDYMLTGDKTLLYGLLGLFLAAWVAYPLINLVKLINPPELVEIISEDMQTADPVEEHQEQTRKFEIPVLSILIFTAGIGVGFFSIQSDGCPFRQHVLAGQGQQQAWFYLIGFYLAALLFDLWSTPLLRFLF